MFLKLWPYVYIFECVHDSYLPKVLELVQEIVLTDQFMSNKTVKFYHSQTEIVTVGV